MSIDISVVIPTFRRPLQLADALASVLTQTGVTLEVLVIDDCPDGSARSVVEAIHDDRVDYARNPHPTGGFPSIVRNLGWPRARGTYVHFLDDDDIVPEAHYAAALAAFESHPGVGLVFGRIEPFGDCPAEQLQRERDFFAAAARAGQRCGRFGTRLAFTGRTLFGSAMLVCSAGLVRRACLEKIGGFDPQIRLLEDTELFCRLMRGFGAHFMDRVTLRYRIGSPSLMHAPNPSAEQLREERECFRRLWGNYRRDRGSVEFLALALITRGLLRFVL